MEEICSPKRTQLTKDLKDSREKPCRHVKEEHARQKYQQVLVTLAGELKD